MSHASLFFNVRELIFEIFGRFVLVFPGLMAAPFSHRGQQVVTGFTVLNKVWISVSLLISGAYFYKTNIKIRSFVGFYREQAAANGYDEG